MLIEFSAIIVADRNARNLTNIWQCSRVSLLCRSHASCPPFFRSICRLTYSTCNHCDCTHLLIRINVSKRESLESCAKRKKDKGAWKKQRRVDMEKETVDARFPFKETGSSGRWLFLLHARSITRAFKRVVCKQPASRTMPISIFEESIAGRFLTDGSIREISTD